MSGHCGLGGTEQVAVTVVVLIVWVLFQVLMVLVYVFTSVIVTGAGVTVLGHAVEDGRVTVVVGPKVVLGKTR